MVSNELGEYPISGRTLVATPAGQLVPPNGKLLYELLGDEDIGYGYDNLQKVASVDRFWSSPETWESIAEWYGRELEKLAWRPHPGDEFVRASAWPWDLPLSSYRFMVGCQEMDVTHYSPSKVSELGFDLPSSTDTVWRTVQLAWTPGHNRFPEEG